GAELHAAFAALYDRWENEEAVADRAQQWRAALEARIADLERLEERYLKELAVHEQALNGRHLGDLIYANLHMFPQRKLGYETTVEVPDPLAEDPIPIEADIDNLSDEDLERLTNPNPPLVSVTVPADKSALQVAQDAHKRASRATRGIIELERRIAQAIEDAAAVEGRAFEWQQHAGLDVVAWKQLIGAVRQGKDLWSMQRARARGTTHAPPANDTFLPNALRGNNIHTYRLPHDLHCWVGGNATANEALWRYGENEQLWLHVRGLPGSHVLIPWPQGQIPSDALVEAARLAVSHSSVKEGTKIPVVFVQVRYLKKPPGTPPGMVTYTRERTLLVDGFNALELKRRRRMAQ
ncbi:MAG: NFACT RNA binding domain-containing protein, partial [bacterium]